MANDISNALKSLSMPMLPLDIIVTEILSRLPAISLARFRCVSRFFRTFISSKEFSDFHLRRTRSSNTNHLLILMDSYLGFESTLYFIYLSFTTTTMMKLPYPQNSNCISKENTLISFVGSCNGLSCFVHDHGDKELVLLINPCTGISKFGIPLEAAEPGTVSFGFGYDSINDDYKVVRYSEYLDKDFYYYVKEVFVYSARANSWRCIEKTPTQYQNHPLCQGVLLNNNLVHWILVCTNDHDRHRRLCCFNLESELWMVDLPLPQIDHRIIDLRVIDGYLGLFTSHSDRHYLWVMKEYGVNESWVKLISVDHIDHSGHLSDTYFLSTVLSAYRRETRKEELLVKAKKISGTNQISEVYCWYNTRDGTYDRLEGIPSNFVVVASSIGSLVNIV